MGRTTTATTALVALAVLAGTASAASQQDDSSLRAGGSAETDLSERTKGESAAPYAIVHYCTLYGCCTRQAVKRLLLSRVLPTGTAKEQSTHPPDLPETLVQRRAVSLPLYGCASESLLVHGGTDRYR